MFPQLRRFLGYSIAIFVFFSGFSWQVYSKTNVTNKVFFINKTNTLKDTLLSGPKFKITVDRGEDKSIPLYYLPFLKQGDIVSFQPTDDFLVPGGKDRFFLTFVFLRNNGFLDESDIEVKVIENQNIPITFTAPRDNAYPIFFFFPKRYNNVPNENNIQDTRKQIRKKITQKIQNSSDELRALGINIEKFEAVNSKFDGFIKALKKMRDGFIAPEEREKGDKATSNIKFLVNIFGLPFSEDDQKKLMEGNAINRIDAAINLAQNVKSIAIDFYAAGKAARENLAKFLETKGISKQVFDGYINLAITATELIIKIVKYFTTSYQYIPTSISSLNESDGYTLEYAPQSETPNRTVRVFTFAPISNRTPPHPDRPRVIPDMNSSCLYSKTISFNLTQKTDEIIKEKFLREWKLVINGRTSDLKLEIDESKANSILSGEISPEMLNQIGNINDVKAKITVYWGTEILESNEILIPVKLSNLSFTNTNIIKSNENTAKFSLKGLYAPCVSRIEYHQDGQPNNLQFRRKNEGELEVDLNTSDLQIGSGILKIFGVDDGNLLEKPLSIVNPKPSVERIVFREGENKILIEGTNLQSIRSARIGDYDVFYRGSEIIENKTLTRLELVANELLIPYTKGQLINVKLIIPVHGNEQKNIEVAPSISR